MGNPFGLDSSVTDGVVSALGRTVPEPGGPTSPGTVLRNAIQTSAPINPGNSGWGSRTRWGRVVESHRAALGLSAVTVTDNNGQPVGVGVTRVQPGGAAAAAGIRDGDVITAVDGTEVKEAQQLLALLVEHRPGDVVQVSFQRAPGAASTVPVTLGELPGG